MKEWIKKIAPCDWKLPRKKEPSTKEKVDCVIKKLQSQKGCGEHKSYYEQMVAETHQDERLGSKWGGVFTKNDAEAIVKSALWKYTESMFRIYGDLSRQISPEDIYSPTKQYLEDERKFAVSQGPIRYKSDYDQSTSIQK